MHSYALIKQLHYLITIASLTYFELWVLPNVAYFNKTEVFSSQVKYSPNYPSLLVKTHVDPKSYKIILLKPKDISIYS